MGRWAFQCAILENDMAENAFKQWYIQGLQALHEASEQGHEAASATLTAVTAPELKQLVEKDTELTQRHAERVDELLRKVGSEPGTMPNKIIEGIRAGNKQVVDAANDEAVRDASVITAAQIALHYYIAAFGTLASSAKHLGMNDDAETLKRMVDETKQQDERFTALAEDMANKRAMAA